MAKHKVESIVSVDELIEQLGSGLSKEEYSKFAVQVKKMLGENQNEKNSKETVIAQAKTIANENKLSAKDQAKEDDRFNRIRQRLIEEMFGVSAKDQAKLMEQGNKASEILAGGARSDYQALKDKENVLGAAETADKNAKRELLAGSLDVALAIGGLASEHIAGLVATITGVSVAFPVIGAALTTFVFGVKLAKYLKSSKQSKSDIASKKEDFLKDVEELTQRIKAFSDMLESKKADILAESKKCKSKEEFNTFIKQKAQEISALVQAKGSELGVNDLDVNLIINVGDAIDSAKYNVQENFDDDNLRRFARGKEQEKYGPNSRVKLEEKQNAGVESNIEEQML